MTDKQKVDFSLEELNTLLKNNFVIFTDNEFLNNGTAFSWFFDKVAEGSWSQIGGYGFFRVKYTHPDSDEGDGDKHLVFTVSKSSWPGPTVEGTFLITGWYDSWDNGKTAGYWYPEIKKVVEKEVTIVEKKWVQVDEEVTKTEWVSNE